MWFATVCPSTRVHAFEPLSRFADVVRRNVTLNELDGKVTLHQVGLSDRPGRATNTLSPEHQWGFHDKPNWVEETFDVAKLDRVLRSRQPVVVMKLDVEGMELSVLRGASRLLSRWRPVVFAEAQTVEEKDEIAAVLRPYGYTETGRVFNSTPTFEFVAPPRVGKERLRLLTQRVHPFWQRLPKWLRDSVGRKIAAQLPETRSWLGGPLSPREVTLPEEWSPAMSRTGRVNVVKQVWRSPAGRAYLSRGMSSVICDRQGRGRRYSKPGLRDGERQHIHLGVTCRHHARGCRTRIPPGLAGAPHPADRRAVGDDPSRRPQCVSDPRQNHCRTGNDLKYRTGPRHGFRPLRAPAGEPSLRSCRL